VGHERAACIAGAVAAVAAVAAAGCVRRADFVPPPAPAPIARPEPVLPAPAGPLTAADAVRLALDRNPDLAAAGARVAGARAGLAEAEAAFWPRLSADVTYLRADAPSAFLFKRIDARSLPPNVNFNDPGAFSNLEEGLALRWNVWSGGRDLLRTWSAGAGVGAAEQAHAAARNALAAAVVAAWLDTRAATELTAADDASVASVESQLARSRVLLEGGSALRSDVLSLEVRLAEAHEQRLRTGVARDLALATLRELLALPPDAPLTLAGGRWDGEPPPADRAEALAEAYRLRPEAQAARRAVERARLDLAAAKRAFLPRLDVGARLYSDDAEARFSPRDPNWTVAFALSVDIADGGARAAAVRQARAALDEITQADRRTLLQVARDVETAYLRLDESRARRDVAARAVDAADETLRLVTEQYRGGAATITRYLETEAARTRARVALVQGDLDVDRAAVETARAMGRFAP
jgi:outer membrane protein